VHCAKAVELIDLPFGDEGSSTVFARWWCINLIVFDTKYGLSKFFICIGPIS